MRIRKTDVIAGLPAPVAREIVRLFFDERPVNVASSILPDTEALSSVQALAEAGYMERVANHRGETLWRTTIQGNALAQASFGRPISRSTADRLVRELVGRASAINADPSYVVSVGRLRLFGSYLQHDVDPLGDVDVELTIVRRLPPDMYVDDARAYTRRSGRNFGTFTQELFWPETELKQILRNRSSAVNITQEDVGRFTDQVSTFYLIEDDPDAIAPTVGEPNV